MAGHRAIEESEWDVEECKSRGRELGVAVLRFVWNFFAFCSDSTNCSSLVPAYAGGDGGTGAVEVFA